MSFRRRLMREARYDFARTIYASSDSSRSPMKFSERWLRTLCDPPISTVELCDTLTMAGLEVEDVTPAAPPFSGVVVGKIESVSAHPNADKLSVCEVDVGAPARLQIVCGAPNAAAGMYAPCALEGATLPGGLAIKHAMMRGVES